MDDAVLKSAEIMFQGGFGSSLQFWQSPKQAWKVYNNGCIRGEALASYLMLRSCNNNTVNANSSGSIQLRFTFSSPACLAPASKCGVHDTSKPVSEVCTPV